MLEQALHTMGYGLCHQLPQRSFFGGGLQVPVCARDTGIYVGFVIALCVIALLHRGERPREFPSRSVWITIGLMVAVMAWDGVTSYAGLRQTTNGMRLITGLMTGYACAAVVVPMLNDTMWANPGRGRVLAPTWRFLVWLATLPLAFAAVLFGGPLLGAFYPVLVSLSIFATLTCVNMVMVGMLPVFDRRGHKAADLLGPAAAGLLLAFGEVALANFARHGLESGLRFLGL